MRLKEVGSLRSTATARINVRVTTALAIPVVAAAATALMRVRRPKFMGGFFRGAATGRPPDTLSVVTNLCTGSYRRRSQLQGAPCEPVVGVVATRECPARPSTQEISR